MERMKFQLKDVKSNPFRDLSRNPIQPAKIEALLESFRTTGFWENIQGRVVEGKIEIAEGHHRIAALRQMYGDNAEFEFNVREMSNDQMLEIMSRSNAIAPFDLSFLIDTVRSTVKALADGEITLPEIEEGTSQLRIGYAPSFKIPGTPESGARPYTALTLALFLGRAKKGDTGVYEADEAINASLAHLRNVEFALPGWDDKTLQGFLKEDGTISARKVLEAANDFLKRAINVYTREEKP